MIRSAFGKAPRIDATAWIEASAQVVGDVTVGARASIWFNAVVRGDVMPVRIGDETNVQDGCVVHVTSEKFSAELGAGVTVGHAAVLHGCSVGNFCLVGIGAIVLDGAVLGPECLVGAGALLTPGTHVPPRSLVVGAPARVKRPLDEQEIEFLHRSAMNYVAYANLYREQDR